MRLNTNKHLQNESKTLTFVKKIFSPVRLIIKYQSFYLYVNDINTSIHKDIMCNVENLTFHSVFLPVSLAEYEKLGQEGFDFMKHPEAQVLDKFSKKGTMVFLTYSNGNLVNRSGVSNISNGNVYNNIIRHFPEYDLIDSKVYQGYNETLIGYRQKGISTWIQSYIFQFLKMSGNSFIFALIEQHRLDAIKVQEKIGSKLISEICEVIFFSAFTQKYRRKITFIGCKWLPFESLLTTDNK